MIGIICSASRRRLPARFTAGLLAAVVALGALAASAQAQPGPRRDEHRRPEIRRDRGRVERPRRYYPAPPVVVGGPAYYAPPPVVVGPAIGINLPGVSIAIQ